MIAGSAVELIAVTKRYPEAVAVDSIDLQIASASYCCLLLTELPLPLALFRRFVKLASKRQSAVATQRHCQKFIPAHSRAMRRVEQLSTAGFFIT